MNLIDDLKWELQKKNNTLVKLIILNISVFVVMEIMNVILHYSGNDIIMNHIKTFISLPSSFWLFLYKPWTILTYAFEHDLGNIFHIIGNMLMLYWFGRILSDLIGSRRLLVIYILGGISAGLLYLFIYNIAINFLKIPNEQSMLMGASGSVYAIIVAAATLSPGYTITLFSTWRVKIYYVAAVVIFLSFIGTIGSNPGGNFAHLGGALFGFLYTKQLQNGRGDIGKPVSRFFDWIEELFKKKAPIKIAYRNTSGTPQVNNTAPNQKEIDDILDKISRSGYESLSTIEKQKLFKASQNQK